MRYVQLRAFHYVAIHGGFSRAANALNLTQPGISDQVRKLENQYDMLLFNRSKKQVSLTEAGKKLLGITHKMFETEQQALDLLNESRALSAGTLRIIADSAHHLHSLLLRFHQKFPRIHISLRTGNSEQVIRELHAYKADIGVLGTASNLGDIDILQLGTSPIVAFARKGFVNSTLKMADLQNLPLVFRENGSKTRQKLEQLARDKNLTLAPVIEAEGREAVLEMVANGAGIGFVSAAELGHDTRVEIVKIDGLDIVMDESLINLRERRNGKLIRAFVALAAQDGPFGKKPAA